MFKNAYQPEAAHTLAAHPGEQPGVEQCILTEEFDAAPAYKEILPDGLISDEV